MKSVVITRSVVGCRRNVLAWSRTIAAPSASRRRAVDHLGGALEQRGAVEHVARIGLATGGRAQHRDSAVLATPADKSS